MKSRIKFTAEFKDKVAIETIKEQSSMAELCKNIVLWAQCATMVSVTFVPYLLA